MMFFYRFVVVFLLLSIFSGCAQKKEPSVEPIVTEVFAPKINGVSLVASKDSLSQQSIQTVAAVNANYASVMPFGFLKSLDHPELLYNQQRQWFGETDEGVKQYIKLLHKSNIKVMMKPQIWVWHGEFTGLLTMASEEDWVQLENTYRNFILDFAKISEEENVAILCIGTELEKFIEHRPDYWRELIVEVKNVYKGKLTYAANWDEYKKVPFWDMLDYIGVDAYFPISEKETPTIAEAKAGWEQWRNELKTVSEKENKKILFAEYGYRNVDFSGKEPWNSDRAITSFNEEAQSNLLEGLYQAVWQEEWFAGGFLWKWFINHEEVGGATDNQFTPQNKAAETFVKTYYTN